MNGVERSNDGVVLRKCPFCGGRVAMNQDDYGYYVSCSEEGCVVMTNSYAEKEAIEKWNKRKPLERVIERLKEEESKYRECAKAELDEFCLEMFHLYDDKAGGLERAIEITKEEMM